MIHIILTFVCLINSFPVNCEIGASADLNCDFTGNCRWRNATDDNGEWMLGSSLEIEPNIKITPMKNNEGDSFAYSTGFMGRTIAMLVSEVVNCQLGGGNIKYWYYQTGEQSQLEVCMRQPPGNRDPNSLRCYDGASSTRAHQWVYRIVELPPASQPFEIVLRATYFPPIDVIAIDDITYNAALCVRHAGVRSEQMDTTPAANGVNVTSRTIRSVPPLIGYRDWQLLKNTDHFKGQTMVIVAQNILDNLRKNQSNEQLLLQTHLTFDKKDIPNTTLIPLPITTTETLSENTESTITSTTQNNLLTTTSVTTTPESQDTTTISTNLETTTEQPQTTNSPETTTPVSQLLPTDNPTASFMNLLKQAAPMLPYIPVLVRTLQSVDPRVQQFTGRGPLDELSEIAKPAGVDLSSLTDLTELRRAPVNGPVAASHFYNTEPVRNPPQQSQENLVALAKKFGILDENIEIPLNLKQPQEVPSQHIQVRTNAFGMPQTTTLRSIKISPTVYPTNLIRNKKIEKLQKHLTESPQRGELQGPRHRSLPSAELNRISELHSQFFPKTGNHIPLPLQTTEQPPVPATELVVFKKPTKTESEVATKLTELAHILPDGALADMSALKDIPDIDGLTKGMDLTLIRKPGGFAKLKKQFVERLMRRTMGLPLNDPSSSLGGSLAPPIVPVKVTRKMMKDRMATQISNDGSNAGAGGTFDDLVTQSPQLIDFNNDRELPYNGKFDDIQNPQEMPGSGRRAAGITSFDPSNQPMSFSAPLKEAPPKPDPAPRTGSLFNPICPLVDCNFDDNTFCNYVTSQSRNVTESLREWSISARGILNSNTGIPKDLTGSFAYAGGLIVSPEETFVLSSNLAIQITEKGQVDFFVYQAGIRGRLRVCLNNLTNCPMELLGSNIDNNARKWKNYGVEVDSGTHAARIYQT